MGFLTPLALLLAALAIPILLLYMLKLQRREVLVSSTLLWQRLLRDREANSPWQRLRRNLLMLLQLLALALLTLALARPFLPSPAIASGSAVILLDTSASMQATDVVPTRFEAARRAARRARAGLGPGDTATIIAVGPQPSLLTTATGDRATLYRALERATPSDGPADWETAFALAAASVTGAENPQTIIISDGAVPEALPPLPGVVHFVQVGQRSANLAIVALAMRESSSGPQAFLRVTNSGDDLAELDVELRADTALFDVRHLTISPHSSAGLTISDLPYDLALLEAHLSTTDPLPLDDTAWATRSPAATRHVLLVTPGNLFLERALESLPGTELTRLAPDQPLPATPYDLLVYDGAVTTTLPTGSLWLIGPYGDAGNVFTNTTIVRTAANDPLLRYVDLDNVHVRQAWRVEPLPGARILVEAEGGPLLFVTERPEGRLAVLSFDLHDSDLPLQVAFPLLVANLTGWLLPPSGIGASTSVQPGSSVPIQPLPTAEKVTITKPDSTVTTLSSPSPVLVADRVGVYQIAQLGPDGELLRADLLAVNLFDAAESDIAPRQSIRVGQVEVTIATQGEEGQRELWPWLAGMALAVLGVEWWVFHQGEWRRNRDGL